MSSGIDYSQIPLQEPPPGEVTDFNTTVSNSWAGRLAIYLTLPIMVVSFLLRAYVRLRKHQVGADDYLLTIGAAASASCCGVLLPIFLVDEWGRHAWDIRLISVKPWFFKYSVTAGLLYNMGAMFTKVSILVFYLRIFSPSRRARWGIWAGIVTICVAYLAITACMMAFELPRSGDGGWGSISQQERMARPAQKLDLTQGIVGVLSDAYVLIIPVFMISRLQLPRNKKIGVGCIFLVGLVSLGCSIGGTVLRYDAFAYIIKDNRWNSDKFLALCIVELNIGIFCACVPVFFVAIKNWVEKAGAGFVYIRSRLTTTRGSQENVATGASSGSAPQIQADVPGGTISGLRTMFRLTGHGGGKQAKGATAEEKSGVEVSQYLELQSIDLDYHAQMRRGSSIGESNRSMLVDSHRAPGSTG